MREQETEEDLTKKPVRTIALDTRTIALAVGLLLFTLVIGMLIGKSLAPPPPLCPSCPMIEACEPVPCVPVTAKEEEPIAFGQLSFADYIENRTYWDGRQATIIGRLNRDYEEDFSAGRKVETVMDDFGIKVGLRSLSAPQVELFPEQGTGEDYYEIKGYFRRKFQGVDVDVISMEKVS